MWKYIKGTQKDFEGLAQNTTWIYNEGSFVASRYLIEDPVVETTKQEEQQPLPNTEDMNPAKDLPKIKLDINKPVFYKETNEEVRFIHSNKRSHIFEKEDCTILSVWNEQLDKYFYNKPEVKTTVELIADAWRHAQNDGSLWASPTQLFYIAIEQLVKNKVIDMDKTYEIEE